MKQIFPIFAMSVRPPGFSGHQQFNCCMSANLINSSEFPKNSREFLAFDADEIAIKDYFTKVLELSKSGEKFPVNLDEVWPLAFKRKDHAVRELTSKFIMDIDYHISPKNGEKSFNGRQPDEYAISVSCLEHLVARRVKEVFEVYRKVFHDSMNNNLPENYLQALKALVAKEEERLRLESENKKLEEKVENDKPFVDFAKNAKTDVDSGMLLIRDVKKRMENHNYFIKEKDLREFLRHIGFFTKNRNSWELTATVIDRGYAKYRYYNDGNGIFVQTACMTERGFKLLISRLSVEKWFAIFKNNGGNFGRNNLVQDSLFGDDFR